MRKGSRGESKRGRTIGIEALTRTAVDGISLAGITRSATDSRQAEVKRTREPEAVGTLAGFADEADSLSPTMLTAFACMFTRFPLAQWESFPRVAIDAGARDAAFQVGFDRQIAKHFGEVNVLLYRLPIAGRHKVVLHRELFEVWIRKVGEPQATGEPKAEDECEDLRERKADFELFVDLARMGSIYLGVKRVHGSQQRQKELLAHLVVAAECWCRADAIFEAIWLRWPNRYHANEATDEERRQRVAKAFRTLRQLLAREGLVDVLEKTGDLYRYRGRQSFCVIPARPTLRAPR